MPHQYTVQATIFTQMLIALIYLNIGNIDAFRWIGCVIVNTNSMWEAGKSIWNEILREIKAYM